jgi:hypothetical protein
MMEEEMKKKDRALRKEQFRIEKALEEMAQLEKEKIDLEKVHRYEELLKILEKLKESRGSYIQSLLSKPIADLLGEKDGQPLKEYYSIFQEEDEISELKQFFSDYPVFGKCNASQICEFFDCSEKKISYICPETSRFRKVVLGNRSLFETIGSLEQTSFLAADGENENALDFYSRNVEGTREIVERIRQLRVQKNSDKEEYEKNRAREKRREEFAKYSKKDLENELKEIGNLLELLHSKAPEEKKDEEQGLLSNINTFLKKLSGKS